MVRVESLPEVAGCPRCGVVAHAHDRDEVSLVDVPSFGRPVRLVWVKRRYACPEPACAGGTFVEHNHGVAAPRALLTSRAVAWAVAQICREHASIAGLARQLGVDWKTLWRAVRADLERLDADPARFDDVRRRVQQDTLGHRGRKGDLLYGIRTILRAGIENLTDRQRARLTAAFTAREDHLEVEVAWHVAQDVRAMFHAPTPAIGRAAAQRLIDALPTCPIPEVRRLGRTLKQWADALLAYFTTDGASNGGTEAVNNLIELHRRIARGFRNYDNYRLRCLLVGGGLTP